MAASDEEFPAQTPAMAKPVMLVASPVGGGATMEPMTDVKDDAAAAPRMRADARRNRERIIQAAREVFAKSGSEAQMDDVATAAGVGVGTVYRHFPNKDALIGELVKQKFETIADGLREAKERGGDPGEALLWSIGRNAEKLKDDLTTQRVLSGDPRPAVWQACAANVTEVNELATELIEGGVASGTLRPDMKVEDIRIVMGGLTTTMADPATRHLWPRHLELLLDALRSPAARER